MDVVRGLALLGAIALIAAAYAAVQHGLWLAGEQAKAWLARRLGVDYEPQEVPWIR